MSLRATSIGWADISEDEEGYEDASPNEYPESPAPAEKPSQEPSQEETGEYGPEEG